MAVRNSSRVRIPFTRLNETLLSSVRKTPKKKKPANLPKSDAIVPANLLRVDECWFNSRQYSRPNVGRLKFRQFQKRFLRGVFSHACDREIKSLHIGTRQRIFPKCLGFKRQPTIQRAFINCKAPMFDAALRKSFSFSIQVKQFLKPMDIRLH
jgi:hypothetical protein